MSWFEGVRSMRPNGATPQLLRRRFLRDGGVVGGVLGGMSGRLVFSTVSVLPACGFQLRGGTASRLPFSKLYTTFSPNSPIGIEFKRSLRSVGGTEVVETPTNAQAWLEVLGEVRDRQVLGFSRTGSAREYQLRLQLHWRLHDGRGHEMIAPTRISLFRDVTAADAQQLVAKQEEDAFLYQDMTTDLVQQLLRQLASVRPADS
jgi:LPS-assembly lipoprotein